MRLPQAIGRANEATLRLTGVDMLAEMEATGMVAAMSARPAVKDESPEDPLRPMVEAWMVEHPEIGEIRSEELVKAILENVPARQMRAAQMRIATVLRDLGWTRRKVAGGPNLWVRPRAA